MCLSLQWRKSSNASRKMVCGELPEELGQEALDNYFDMRQGEAESIQDYIFREENLTVALKKDTAVDLDQKIRGYWLMTSRSEKFQESRSSLRGRQSSRMSRRPSPRRLLQRSVRRSGTICEMQETERETALEDMLKPRISISMERVLMTKRTGFQTQSRVAQKNGTIWVHKNKKL